MQILVPMERVEWERGLEIATLVVHSIFLGVVVPQMWEFPPHTALFSKLWPKSTAVAQVVHRNLLLKTGTSFLRSLELGSGKQH